MIQQCLATFAMAFSAVFSGKVDSQYFVSSDSSFGHFFWPLNQEPLFQVQLGSACNDDGPGAHPRGSEARPQRPWLPCRHLPKGFDKVLSAFNHSGEKAAKESS